MKMPSTFKIIIWNLIALISIITVTNSKIVSPSWLTDQDIKSLHSLEPKQALPIVFIDYGENDKFRFPMCLGQVEIEDGRLKSGTEFMMMSSKNNQILFCPHPNKSKQCLYPKRFKKSEILQCENELQPIIEVHPDPNLDKNCGPNGTGTLFARIYKICEPEKPFSYKIRNLIMYTFCYEESSKRILFVTSKTVSSGLFLEKALIQEQKIQFQELISDTNGKIDKDYYTKLITESELKPEYKFKMLLWPEYMPFAMWRKSAYHYINVALQHQALHKLWDEITGYIKNYAIKSFDSPPIIVTGTSDIPEQKILIKKDNNQIYNIWYTAIMDRNTKSGKGLIVMFNNFITEEKETNDGNYLDENCQENLCMNDLKQKFAEIGGQVRCCKLTRSLSKLFYSDKQAVQIDEILNIQGLTTTKSE